MLVIPTWLTTTTVLRYDLTPLFKLKLYGSLQHLDQVLYNYSDVFNLTKICQTLFVQNVIKTTFNLKNLNFKIVSTTKLLLLTLVKRTVLYNLIIFRQM